MPIKDETVSQPSDLYHGNPHIPLTHWPLGNLDAILKLQFSISFYWLVSSQCLMILVIMPWDECHGTLLVISQHCAGNGLVPLGNKPLPEPMLTEFHVAIWRHQATMSKSNYFKDGLYYILRWVWVLILTCYGQCGLWGLGAVSKWDKLCFGSHWVNGLNWFHLQCTLLAHSDIDLAQLWSR